jgi:hypothetical protein
MTAQKEVEESYRNVGQEMGGGAPSHGREGEHLMQGQWMTTYRMRTQLVRCTWLAGDSCC